MSYTAATQMPDLNYFQWSRNGAENPRLKAPISSTATTIVVTNAALDKDGSAITGSFLMGCTNKEGFTELIWIPAAASTDGITFAGCVRGVRPQGLDYTTGDTSFAVKHDQDDAVFCSVAAVNFDMMINTLQGVIGTGANNWQIGDGTNVDSKIYAFNGDANKPYWGYDASANSFVYSNDGVSTTSFGTGAGVTGGDGITVTAGAIAVDLTDVTTFRDSRNGNEKIGVATAAADGLIALNFLTANLNEADTFFGATDATGAEMETLTDGSVADSKHIHRLMDLTRLNQREEYKVYLDGVAVANGGTVTDNGDNKVEISTAAAANGMTGYKQPTYSGSTITSVDDKNPSFYVVTTFAAATAQDGFIGFVDQAMAGTSVEDNVMTLNHCGFVISDAQVAISVSNGTQTKENVTCTVTNQNQYYMTFDGTTATFYINGSAVGSPITTNVPAGDMDAFFAVVIADATNAAKTMTLKKSSTFSFDLL